MWSTHQCGKEDVSSSGAASVTLGRCLRNISASLEVLALVQRGQEQQGRGRCCLTLCKAKDSLVLPPRPNLAHGPSMFAATSPGDEQQQTFQRPAVEIGSWSSVLQNAEHDVSKVCSHWQAFYFVSGGTRRCLVWVNGKKTTQSCLEITCSK